jgi:hypothetical protein
MDDIRLNDVNYSSFCVVYTHLLADVLIHVTGGMCDCGDEASFDRKGLLLNRII